MKVETTRLPGVLLITPRVHGDARGFFLETYNEHRYREAGITERFVQDNHSQSRRGTLRGLHAQMKHPQGKLVRVIEGEIFDVAVDIRRASPHFAKWTGAHLTATGFEQIYIPPGFAHGFCVLSERAQVEYKCTALYDPSDEICIAWNDPDIAIDWPIRDPVLSPRDRAAPTLKEFSRGQTP